MYLYWECELLKLLFQLDYFIAVEHLLFLLSNSQCVLYFHFFKYPKFCGFEMDSVPTYAGIWISVAIKKKCSIQTFIFKKYIEIVCDCLYIV